MTIETTERANVLDKINLPSDLRELSRDDLPQLAKDVRNLMIDAVSQTGGHLGAGLGVVELTIALHYVFNTPKDKIIWDVGHQAYPHKILTGRKDRIHTLRKGGGLSGFTKRSESEYDPFGAAHSSTSISAGFGMVTAGELSNDNFHVISVIGDGAMSAGMAYEALNNVGASKKKQIVILNDNNMSIAPPVGAMSDYLTKLWSGKTYQAFRGKVAKLADTVGAKKTAKKIEEFTKGMTIGGTWFEEMGFHYYGPIDGHDFDILLPVLENLRDNENSPILLHVVTQKGKGYAPAEAACDKYHGVVPFDPVTGVQQKSSNSIPSYTNVFAGELIKQAQKDDKIVAITAAMPTGTGVDKFSVSFPERSFDVGIAEQHAVTFAAGMATEGYKPYCAIYSTFLQRAYDQIVHDVTIQSLPVRFMIDRAGLVGADGATHAGSFDIAYLGCLPNMVLMAAANEQDLIDMVATTVEINDKASALRYPRGNGWGLEVKPAQVLKIGKGEIVRQGQKIALLCYGDCLSNALKAGDLFKAEYGYDLTVANAKFAKPLDNELIKSLSETHDAIITIEHGSIGGFGSFVLDYAQEENLFENCKFKSMYLPDIYQDQDTPEKMYEQAGLDARAIFEKAKGLF